MYTLPPPFTPLLTALIGDQRLSASLFRSYARLYAAAWAFAYQCTAALDFESQVVALLGVSRSQARQHLRLLRQIGLLDWSSDGSHRYIFRFTSPQLSIYPGPGEQPIRAALPDASLSLEEAQAGNSPGNVSDRAASQTHTSGKAGPAAKTTSGSDSRHSDYGGVEVNLSNHLLNHDRFTQQHTHSEKTYGSSAAKQSTPADPNYTQAFSCLRQAGVWSKIAERLAQQIAANEQSDDPELSGIGDLLGWTAYCFADRKQNQISNPAAVLAANLTNNRPCPRNYQPPLICENCHRTQEYCRCQPDKVRYSYPKEFVTLALKGSNKYSTYTDRWGVCMYCHAIPCQCIQE